MISVELIRRFPFFAELNFSQLETLAKSADEMVVDSEHYFFHEGEELNRFYVVKEGDIAIVVGIPNPNVEHRFVDQLNHTLSTENITVSTLVRGDMFGWSALVPPHKTTAGAKALTPCQVLAFDCAEIRPHFNGDCQFAYMMTMKAAQTIRERLQSIRTESLASHLPA